MFSWFHKNLPIMLNLTSSGITVGRIEDSSLTLLPMEKRTQRWTVSSETRILHPFLSFCLPFRSLVQNGQFSNWSSNVGLIFIGAEKPTDSNQWKWSSTDRTGEFLDERFELKLWYKQTLSISLFENGGDPNGRCAFLNMLTFKIQRGDCNKDGAFFFCTSGKTT